MRMAAGFSCTRGSVACDVFLFPLPLFTSRRHMRFAESIPGTNACTTASSAAIAPPPHRPPPKRSPQHRTFDMTSFNRRRKVNVSLPAIFFLFFGLPGR